MGESEMKSENVYGLYTNYRNDKSGGVKRQPLSLLLECCEAAGITVSKYKSLVMKYPPAPKPVLAVKSLHGKMYIKKEVVKWIKECLEKENLK
jgi:hypothetical protein